MGKVIPFPGKRVRPRTEKPPPRRDSTLTKTTTRTFRKGGRTFIVKE